MYPSRAGRVYQVWKTDTLTGVWQPAGPLVSGDDTVKVHNYPMTGSSGFFRVVVDLP